MFNLMLKKREFFACDIINFQLISSGLPGDLIYKEQKSQNKNPYKKIFKYLFKLYQRK